MTRRLIVNADDFGQSAGINRGIAACHEAGVVRSASLMVRWPAAAAAAVYARQHPSLGVGLHLDLGEWTYRDDRWQPLYDVVPLDDEAAVRLEVERQIGAFERLMGRPPTHLDSHQHAHRETAVREVALDAARRLDVPLREYTPWVRYDGRFYGHGRGARPCHGSISLAHLLTIVETLPDGTTELGCHPAIGTDVDSVYREEREMEVRVLCDPRARAAIVEAGVELVSFAEAMRSRD